MPTDDGFRIDIACPDQPRESDPCARRDGYRAAPDGDCRTCGKHTGPAAGPGYPTPDLERTIANLKAMLNQTDKTSQEAS